MNEIDALRTRIAELEAQLEVRRPSLTELQARAHATAVEKGWWPEGDSRSFGELVALCHSELSEALEEYRKGFSPRVIYKVNGKPEGIPVELADLVIRVFDMCGFYGVDLEEAIEMKMQFNAMRPQRHGGKKI